MCMFCVTYDSFVQDCSNSSALAMELLQSCSKPTILYMLTQYTLLKFQYIQASVMQYMQTFSLYILGDDIN